MACCDSALGLCVSNECLSSAVQSLITIGANDDEKNFHVSSLANDDDAHDRSFYPELVHSDLVRL